MSNENCGNHANSDQKLGMFKLATEIRLKYILSPVLIKAESSHTRVHISTPPYKTWSLKKNALKNNFQKT